MKKVSVIIPFYNGIHWLCEAVESALNQTYSNIEIIIVNDGSTEDVTEFLKKFGDSIVYAYQKNQGAASARNYGIKLANGDYIAFLDADDIWLPTKLEKQIFFMEEIGAMWCHTNYYYWNPVNNSLKNVGIKDEYGDIFEKTFVSLKMATPSVLISKHIFNLIDNLEFPSNTRIGEDTKFWQKISKEYPVALLTEPLVKVRLREDNTFKRTLDVLHYRALNYIAIKDDKNIPKFARFRGRFFYIYGKILKLPATPRKDLAARILISIPYILGRIYVKYLSFLNVKYKKFIK